MIPISAGSSMFGGDGALDVVDPTVSFGVAGISVVTLGGGLSGAGGVGAGGGGAEGPYPSRLARASQTARIDS